MIKMKELKEKRVKFKANVNTRLKSKPTQFYKWM